MKNKKLPNAIALLILTTITVVFWISFTIYSAVNKETPFVIPNDVIAPLNPKLDIETLDEIEKRADENL